MTYDDDVADRPANQRCRRGEAGSDAGRPARTANVTRTGYLLGRYPEGLLVQLDETSGFADEDARRAQLSRPVYLPTAVTDVVMDNPGERYGWATFNFPRWVKPQRPGRR